MAIGDLPGTTEYLTNAAHLLRQTAPEISAHLMSQRNQLLYEQKISQTDIQLQRSCGGCGTIHLPPTTWQTVKPGSGKKSLRKGKVSTRPASNTARNSVSYRLLQCPQCARETKIELPGPGPAVRSKTKMTAKVQQKGTAPQAPKPTANASSKKRAKNRKAGLQALLSGQQQQASSPLSLANFMK
ncbi:hypothetical protein BGZ63DRAFT_56180 [Mariannaea sp. PMI_226]|nr:hypothetical protein BGZ63DRAFT_56180 [Mariannaea sp. PMI_226]